MTVELAVLRANALELELARIMLTLTTRACRGRVPVGIIPDDDPGDGPGRSVVSWACGRPNSESVTVNDLSVWRCLMLAACHHVYHRMTQRPVSVRRRGKLETQSRYWTQVHVHDSECGLWRRDLPVRGLRPTEFCHDGTAAQSCVRVVWKAVACTLARGSIEERKQWVSSRQRGYCVPISGILVFAPYSWF